MDTEAPDVGFVTVTWGVPLVSRCEVLESSEFVPGITPIDGYVEMCRMSTRIETLAIRTHTR